METSSQLRIQKTKEHHCAPNCGPHLCVFCGVVFQPHRSDQRFCSKKHAAAVWKATQAKTCSVEGCDGMAIAGLRSGWCPMHRWRWRYGKPLEGPKQHVGAPCLVEGCRRKSTMHGYCGMHALRIKAHGEPGAVDPIIAPRGAGHLTKDGYLRITTADHEHRPQHRVVMEGLIGRPLLPHETVHHLNGVRSDNRPKNLELWSKSHPYGQRVADKLAWAKEIVREYGDLVDRMHWAPEGKTTLIGA